MEKNTPDYHFRRNTDIIPNPKDYELHNHYGAYEIFIFLNGDADYIVEGTVYPLKKYDTLILSPNEFHHIIHHSSTKYERVVLHINNSFFTRFDCDEFRRMFDSRKIGTKNLIPASFIIENKVMDIIERAEKYEKDSNNDIVIRCIILELLHVLNKYHHSSPPSSGNTKITPVIMYINENLSSSLSIENISEKFFLNKYYLCRIFKKYTGLTINKYITHKRIAMVKDLYQQGKTLTQASIESGFGNYSNFYKMYVKETGRSPREDMKDI